MREISSYHFKQRLASYKFTRRRDRYDLGCWYFGFQILEDILEPYLQISKRLTLLITKSTKCVQTGMTIHTFVEHYSPKSRATVSFKRDAERRFSFSFMASRSTNWSVLNKFFCRWSLYQRDCPTKNNRGQKWYQLIDLPLSCYRKKFHRFLIGRHLVF